MAEANNKAASGGKKLDIKKILPILLMGINLAGIGIGSFLTFKSTLGWERPKIVEEDLTQDLNKQVEDTVSHPILYTMEPFTVNLDGLPERTLHLEVNLRLLGDEGFEEVITLGPEARDSIIRLLNAKTFNDLETIQGKLFLKDQIATTINGLLKNGVVKDVYFTQFNVAVR